MKQTVNWYKGDVKPTKRTLTLARALTATSAVIVLCLLAWLLLSVTAGSDRSALDQLQARNSELTEQLTSLQSRLENRQPSPRLQQQKQELEQRVSDRQALLNVLQGFDTRAVNTPVTLMRELAEITPEGLWLTRFGLTAEGIIELQGAAGRSNRLALWMMRFSETELLSRTAFAMVELARDEQGQQLFTLRSKRDNEGNQSVSEAAQ